MDQKTETDVLTLGYIKQMRELALQLCEAVPMEQRKGFLFQWDDSSAPYLSVADVESGKADDILEGLKITRALIVAAYNMDRASKSKLK